MDQMAMFEDQRITQVGEGQYQVASASVPGQYYTVTNGECECKGFENRGRCRHATMLVRAGKIAPQAPAERPAQVALVVPPVPETLPEGKPIILLDLNYTLAANSGEVIREGRFYNVGRERYREWLAEMVSEFYVVLITVRPDRHRVETLNRIAAQLDGWRPDEAYFNEWNFRAPQCKQTVIEKYVFPRLSRPEDTWYVALESNDQTAEMYANYGIQRHRAKDVEGAPWKLLAPGRVSPQKRLF